MARHEIEDEAGNFVVLLLQREVAGIQQMNFRVRQVGAEGRRTRRDEGRIVGAPGDQRRRLVFAKPSLPGGVGCDVRAVVVEQGRLDLALTGLREMGKFVGPAFRVISFRMRGAGQVSLLRRLIGKKGVDDLRVRLRISPKFGDLRPFRPSPTL